MGAIGGDVLNAVVTCLEAARKSLCANGYAGTTIRGIARAAALDPALVHHCFGTKESLFGVALELPFDPATLLPRLVAGGREGLGERVVRTFLVLWDATPGQGPMLALLRSAVSDGQSAASLRDLLSRAVLRPLAAAAQVDDADLRAALAASQVVGLAVARYVVRLEPVASASVDVLAAALGPTLDRYLTGPLS